ncbi:MAG: restriction endonuclease subunit S [Prevotella sp.]|nr:restriction endonuclease subunit S [Prevotella sp.]
MEKSLRQKLNDLLNKQAELDISLSKRLPKSILQEAIQGKLVLQIAEEGTAQELLKQIKLEKQKLVKEGKLKKTALSDSVIFKGEDNRYYEQTGKTVLDITDEIPFEIPEKWCWIRLGSLFQHNTGKALNRADNQGKLLSYITTSNLYWNRFELNILKKMYFTDTEIEKCTVTKGDLLVCEGGDIGRAAVWNYDENIRIQNHIHRLRSFINVDVYFYLYVFYFYKSAGLIGGKGIGIQGLSTNVLHNLLIPLPPLAEQHRIVAKIEKLFEKLQ